MAFMGTWTIQTDNGPILLEYNVDKEDITSALNADGQSGLQYSEQDVEKLAQTLQLKESVVNFYLDQQGAGYNSSASDIFNLFNDGAVDDVISQQDVHNIKESFLSTVYHSEDGPATLAALLDVPESSVSPEALDSLQITVPDGTRISRVIELINSIGRYIIGREHDMSRPPFASIEGDNSQWAALVSEIHGTNGPAQPPHSGFDGDAFDEDLTPTTVSVPPTQPEPVLLRSVEYKPDEVDELPQGPAAILICSVDTDVEANRD